MLPGSVSSQDLFLAWNASESPQHFTIVPDPSSSSTANINASNMVRTNLGDALHAKKEVVAGRSPDSTFSRFQCTVWPLTIVKEARFQSINSSDPEKKRGFLGKKDQMHRSFSWRIVISVVWWKLQNIPYLYFLSPILCVAKRTLDQQTLLAFFEAFLNKFNRSAPQSRTLEYEVWVAQLDRPAHLHQYYIWDFFIQWAKYWQIF